VSYRLRMSGEIHDWLADLHQTDPAAALLVGQALAALMSEGASLGPPLVVPVAETWPEDLAAALDASHQYRLDRLQLVRKRAAEAACLVRDIQDQVDELESARARLEDRRRRALEAGRKDEAEQAGQRRAVAERDIAKARQLLPWLTETEAWLRTRLQRLQRRTNESRVRNELLKATYVAARAELQVAEEIPAASDPQAAAEAAARLRDVTAEIRQELGRQPLPDGLLELRPTAATSTGTPSCCPRTCCSRRAPARPPRRRHTPTTTPGPWPRTSFPARPPRSRTARPAWPPGIAPARWPRSGPGWA
jgi:phage shock protein A